ncbi:MAG: thioesterase family protein [Alphaproteobacteria bacterium]
MPAEADVNLHDPAQYRLWQEEHVRFGDLDINGHVNNLATGEYFENARVALHRQVFPEWPRVPHLFVLAHAAFDYYRELHYPAQVRIGTRLVKFGRTSMHLGAALFRNQDLIAQCRTIMVLIDVETRQPIEIPATMRAAVSAIAG